MTTGRWIIRLGGEAEKDFAHILRNTRDKFGSGQVEIYRATLLDALSALSAGPNVTGSAPRDEIQPGIRSLHVARRGRRGRHFIMYRTSGDNTIEIVRILYDGMDLSSHIP